MWWKETDEYKAISNFYKDETAKRSRVPLINHINEGVEILVDIDASEWAIRGFILHPIFQGNLEWRVNVQRCEEFSSYVMALVFEYRKCANSYLCTEFTDKYTLSDVKKVVDIPIKDVRDMLYADKLQNRKDFNTYHKNKHIRSMELTKYFDIWIQYLNKWEAK